MNSEERQTMLTLADFLEEAHESEIDNNHSGDGPDCTYCDAIAAARRLLAFSEPVQPVEICSECGSSIPDVPGGSLVNRHHSESCSLHPSACE